MNLYFNFKGCVVGRNGMVRKKFEFDEILAGKFFYLVEFV